MLTLPFWCLLTNIKYYAIIMFVKKIQMMYSTKHNKKLGIERLYTNLTHTQIERTYTN